MKKEKTITLITATKNRPSLLKRCRDSIFAQTILPDEWIIIISGDPAPYEDCLDSIVDSSFASNCKPNVRIIFAPGVGTSTFSNSLKLAHQYVTSDYVGWIDDDDELDPSCIEVLKLEAQGELTYTDYDVVDGKTGTRSRGILNRCSYSYESMLNANILHHFRLYSLDLYDRVGGIDTSFNFAPGYELTLRMLKQIYPERPKKIDKPLYYYHVHDRQMSKIDSLCNDDLIRAAKIHS